MSQHVIQARPLSNGDLEALLQEDWLHEAEHMYLLHSVFLALGQIKDEPEGFQGEFYGAFSEEGLEGLLFLRAGYSFVLGKSSERAGLSFAPILLASSVPPRLGIGPSAGMSGLVPRLAKNMKIRFDRSQPFMEIRRGMPPGPGLGVGVVLRQACMQDVEWLVRANLVLNHEDLQFDPRYIHMEKLRERIQKRVERRETWVLERAGKPVSKLDIGFENLAGALIEGVFTDPKWRGRGFGTRLVSSLCSLLLKRVERVGLHLARENSAARRAYEAAGLHEVADLRLVLFN